MDAPPLGRHRRGPPLRLGQKELGQQEVSWKKLLKQPWTVTVQKRPMAPPAAVRWTGNGKKRQPKAEGPPSRRVFGRGQLSPPGGSSQHDPPVRGAGCFEPVLEYNPLSPSPKLWRGFLSSLSRGALPPRPRLAPGEAQFREPLRRHRAPAFAADSVKAPSGLS